MSTTRSKVSFFTGLIFMLLLSMNSIGARVSAANWPAWRGRSGSGVSPEIGLPTVWNATQNIRWKTALSDPGNSSPIVWEDKVFITQASETKNLRSLVCFNRKDGRLLWESSVMYADPEESHRANPHCSSSPVTDGERIIVWHGSAGVLCYDMNGKEIWRRDLGKQIHTWGYASSPVIEGNLCFLNFGPGPRQFLIALDKSTGKTAWEYTIPQTDPAVKRTDGFAGQEARAISGSWSTPIIIDVADHKELVFSSPGSVLAFDPASGKPLWHCDGLNPLLYTSTVFGDGVVVAMGGYMGPTFAVKPGGRGDVTLSHRLWYKPRSKNRIGSGVISNGYMFVLNAPGTAECIDLKTGDSVWEERVGSGSTSESWSSMLLAGDTIYVPNQSGETILLKASPKFQLMGINSIGGEMCNSSLAASNGDLFLRTHKNLWCISDSPKKTEIR